MFWLYRALIRACPAALRDSYGDEMVAIARVAVDNAAERRGAIGRRLAELRAVIDLVLFIATSRRDARHPAGWRPFSWRRVLMMRDIKSAFRQMRSRPLFAATVVLMLALGMGATTAIFSVVNGVLLTPLSVPEPDRIAEIWAKLPARSIDQMVWAEGNTWDLIDRNHSFSDIGAYHSATFSMTGVGDPERVEGGQVSVGFLRTLGVAPLAGRFFEPGEDATGATATRVVVSERLWTRAFNRDTRIIGQTISLDAQPYTVIGVAPDGPVWLGNDDVFVPFIRRLNADRGSWEYTMIGRLKPGVTFEAAEADLNGVMSQLREFKDNDGISVTVNDTAIWMATPELRRTLWVMLASTFLLLVIAGVNVTNLLFVRAASRARERAVRTALGASRADLVRESVTESLIISVLGAIAGSALAATMLTVFKAQTPGGIPRLADVTIDGTVLLFTIGVALIVALATGLLPAWRTPFGQITAALREGQRGSVGDRRLERTRAMFVALEVAVSVLLLIGAALLVRSLTNVLNTDRGFATENRLTAEVSIPRAWDPVRRSTVARQISDGIGALPDIQSVAVVSGPMLAGGGTGMSFAAANTTTGVEQAPWATWRIITPDYFKTIGLTLLSGRNFEERDKVGKPWRVIISDRLAKEIWPGQNAVGQTALLWKGQGDFPAEIVGVVSDIREHRLDDEPTREVYLPADETSLSATTLRLVMHTRGRAEDAGPAVRALVKSIDGSLPVSRVRSVEALVNRSVATRRFTMQLLAIFAAVAAILALCGVAGVLAYSMSQRRKEMGLRLALGAHASQLIGLAMRMGLWPVVIGLIVGAGAALWLSRLLTSLLFDITPYDPATYAAVGTSLFVAAALACYLPARTVLRVDPAEAMRED